MLTARLSSALYIRNEATNLQGVQEGRHSGIRVEIAGLLRAPVTFYFFGDSENSCRLMACSLRGLQHIPVTGYSEHISIVADENSYRVLPSPTTL